MARNLDLTALRSFVAIAETGGVTRAAGFLNLTQSAVSMQLKRLEESLDVALFDRANRSLALTTAGEQLLSYARRMLDLNDEIYAKMTDCTNVGEIVLGVPHDIVYPAIPQVLQRFSAEFPRMRVNLVSSYTSKLKGMFARGECQIILGTEEALDAGGTTLVELPLRWVGAPGGSAWRRRPLRLAFEQNCRFRIMTQRALDAAGIPWEMAVETESSRAVEATVSADLAVSALIDSTLPQQMEFVSHDDALPELANQQINLYVEPSVSSAPQDALVEMITHAFCCNLRRDNDFTRRLTAAE
ncbi:MAG: LysR family transcriptional regulator [Pseudomonadota bacterium]